MELSLRRIENQPLDLWREGEFFSDIESGMDCLFDEVFGGSCVTYVVPETRGAYSPRIDINETADGINVSAEMPGMSQDNIDVRSTTAYSPSAVRRRPRTGEKC